MIRYIIVFFFVINSNKCQVIKLITAASGEEQTEPTPGNIFDESIMRIVESGTTSDVDRYINNILRREKQTCDLYKFIGSRRYKRAMHRVDISMEFLGLQAFLMDFNFDLRGFIDRCYKRYFSNRDITCVDRKPESHTLREVMFEIRGRLNYTQMRATFAKEVIAHEEYQRMMEEADWTGLYYIMSGLKKSETFQELAREFHRHHFFMIDFIEVFIFPDLVDDGQKKRKTRMPRIDWWK